MKYFWPVFLALMFAAAVFSQQPPTLSTADRVAIQTFEKSKQDAQKQFQDAQQGELTVLREWQAAHPGWHVDQTTFAVEKDTPPAPNPEPKKESPKP